MKRIERKKFVGPLLASISSVVAVCGLGCASGREFWTYVVEPPVEKTLAREKGTPADAVASPHVIKVAYSDGSTSTEVQVPVLSSGQQVIVDHKGRSAQESIGLVPLPPAASDKALEESYLRGGRPITAKAAPVSITKTRAMVNKLVKQGNLSLALEYVEQLLQRYPQHVESLRTKGSILMKMGEREAALETYRRAEEIESDPQVRRQVQELEKALNGR